MNSTLTDPVATYLAQIRAELSDLPPGELEDVLDDVTGHLTEVAVELDGEPTAEALQKRLGTPREYVDELRTAAGYPPRKQQGQTAANPKAALRWGIVAATVGPFFVLIGMLDVMLNGRNYAADPFFVVLGLVIIAGCGFLGVRALHHHDPSIVAETPKGEKLAGSIRGQIVRLPQNARRDLKAIGQPVWWVGRGIVAGGSFFAVVATPKIPVFLMGALVGALVSIWIGRRTQQDRRWLWFIVPLNVVATIAVPVWLAASPVGHSWGYVASSYSSSDGVGGNSATMPGGLSYDGTPVQNVFPFDAQGKPLTGIRLYTESGIPLEIVPADCASQYERAVPGNVFPQMTVFGDGTDPESCQQSDKPTFKVLPPLAGSTTAPTPTTPTGTGGPTTPTEPEVTQTIRPLR
ncbi:MAG TPA: hypothetical protein VGD71_32900 [Kribbella sp.]